LERLIDLRLIERTMAVGEPARSKRRTYRIIDQFIRFHLGIVSKYRGEIERGLGTSIRPVLRQAIDDHMGDAWEEAFQAEIRRRGAGGTLPVTGDVAAVGSWWDTMGQNQIDALVLVGRSGTPALAGEAKWSTTANARALVGDLRRKVELGLHVSPDGLRYAVCARRDLSGVDRDVLALTAADLFSIDTGEGPSTPNRSRPHRRH
jgi:uncharacterized protein